MQIEHIQTADNDPKWNMPYTPAIKVTGGSTIYVSGVTATTHILTTPPSSLTSRTTQPPKQR